MHGLTIEARLKDYKRIQKLKKEGKLKKEVVQGCKFELHIDCNCLGPHKFSFGYLIDKLYFSKTRKDNKGIPHIEAELKMKLNDSINQKYRKLHVKNDAPAFTADIPYEAHYFCEGHSYVRNGRIPEHPKNQKGFFDNAKKDSVIKTCEGCKFYK